MKIKNRYLDKIAYAIICSSVLLSCGTTKNAADNNISEILIEEPIKIQETQTPSPAEIYKEKVSGLKITSVSFPKETVKNRAFSGPFSVKVTNLNGDPASGTEITVKYPVSKKGDDVIFETVNLLSDENGIVSFTSQIPSYSFNSAVSFFPAGDFSDPLIAAEADKHSVSVKYQVKTNLMWNGSICIVDFDQKGKPLSGSASSSNLLKQLMILGFGGIGNADFNSQVLNGDPDTVYKAAKKLMGNTSSFMIFGTIQYEKPVVKTEEGWVCTLLADITCLNMKNGEILYNTIRKVSVTDKSDWNAINNAKIEIAKEIAQAVKYGM